MEGTDFTVTATDDDDLISAYAQRGIATRLGELADRNGIEPLLVEDVLQVERVDLGRRIEGLLQAEAR